MAIGHQMKVLRLCADNDDTLITSKGVAYLFRRKNKVYVGNSLTIFWAKISGKLRYVI